MRRLGSASCDIDKAEGTAKKATKGGAKSASVKRASRRALCVGINDYPYRGSDLNGCVNDARAWAELLIGQYGFAATDVKMLLDQEDYPQNPQLEGNTANKKKQIFG